MNYEYLISQNDEESVLNEDNEDTKSSSKNNDCLYDLGIGLAGVGLAVELIEKDNDKDEEKE